VLHKKPASSALVLKRTGDVRKTNGNDKNRYKTRERKQKRGSVDLQLVGRKL
jgi:hypothetical protein